VPFWNSVVSYWPQMGEAVATGMATGRELSARHRGADKDRCEKRRITLVASDIQENRKQPFLERRAIPLKNLGRRGLNKFWDVEVGVLEDG
jgi:hypothetical protein